FIPLNCDDDEVIAYARHLDGKTLLVVANRNMNMTKSANIQIPRLKINQKLNNLLPTYGEKSRFQTNNEALKAELGAGRIHVFEIDTPAIEKSGLNVYKQNF
ncbi:alpha amylase C-terminal domain-containing protein, partial [bacterium]|nr:alpha amylase C-terminal domain-containing protein [bacterium]